MKELTLAATLENIETVTDFVNVELEANDCPMKVQMQIDIAIDEIFSNPDSDNTSVKYLLIPDISIKPVTIKYIITTFVDVSIIISSTIASESITLTCDIRISSCFLSIFEITFLYLKTIATFLGRTCPINPIGGL